MAKTAFVVLVALALFCQAVRATQGDFYDDNILRTLHLEFSQPDWWQQLTSNYQSKQNIPATLTVDDVTYEGVGVRFRGFTSYMMANSQKKSFNIEIDYTIEDQRLMGYKTLNLINCLEDPTFMREVLYSNTCRKQIPSAKANFVKLVINGENWGIYANIQQLNAEFIEDWFPSSDGTRWRAEGIMGGGRQPGGGQTPDGGGQTPGGGARPLPNQNNLTLAEPGGAGGFGNGSAALTWQGSDSTIYEQAYELKSTKQDDPWASLIHTCDVLNNTPLEQLPDVLDEVLNVDRALWLCAFEIVFHDDDGYIWKRGSDYYLYYEPETGRIHLIQYDGNSCMRSSGTTGWSLFYRSDDPMVPLMYRLMAINQYRQRYLAHVRTILDSFLTEDALWPKIDAYKVLIEQEVQMDNKKLYTTQAFLSGITTLKSFIQTRRAVLLANREVDRPIPDILSVDYDIIQEQTGQSLVITAQLDQTVPVADVQLFLSEGAYGPFAAQPMSLDKESGGTRYMITLPIYLPGTVLRYYVQATAADGVGTLTFNPAGAEHEVYTYVATYAKADASPVVINELMARNVTTIADPQGDYDDWIELFNTSNETVDMSGMYLSDNPENPLKWRFPAGTTVDSGSYLIVWADENGGDEPGLHTNFKLSSQGETLWLYDTDAHSNALLDSVSFEALQADQSMGRVPDGQGPMQILPVPSPLEPNLVPSVVEAIGSVITMADDDANG
jgi:hypothetical protein